MATGEEGAGADVGVAEATTQVRSLLLPRIISRYGRCNCRLGPSIGK
jgi:hypothetical protein